MEKKVFRLTPAQFEEIRDNYNRERVLYVEKSAEFDPIENILIELVLAVQYDREKDNTDEIITVLEALKEQEYFQNCIDYALIYAVRNLNLKLTEKLIDMGAKPVCTMLILGITKVHRLGDEVEYGTKKVNIDFLASFKLLNGSDLVKFNFSTKNEYTLFQIFEGEYYYVQNFEKIIGDIIELFIKKFKFKITKVYSDKSMWHYNGKNLYQEALSKELFKLTKRLLKHNPAMAKDIEYTFKLLENMEIKKDIFIFQLDNGFDINSIYKGHNLLSYLARMYVVHWNYSDTQIVTYKKSTESMLIKLTKLLIERGINLKHKVNGLNILQVASVLETGVYKHLKTLDPKAFE